MLNMYQQEVLKIEAEQIIHRLAKYKLHHDQGKVPEHLHRKLLQDVEAAIRCLPSEDRAKILSRFGVN